MYKTGGMVLIRVGDQEIDFNPNFTMFMITRNINAKFTPDLCLRVTFVNFTLHLLPCRISSSTSSWETRDPMWRRRESVSWRFRKSTSSNCVSFRNHCSTPSATCRDPSSRASQSSLPLEKLKTEGSKITEEMKKSNTIMAEL